MNKSTFLVVLVFIYIRWYGDAEAAGVSK